MLICVKRFRKTIRRTMEPDLPLPVEPPGPAAQVSGQLNAAVGAHWPQRTGSGGWARTIGGPPDQFDRALKAIPPRRRLSRSSQSSTF
jgi:hypothetical protein